MSQEEQKTANQGIAVVILNWNGAHWLKQFLPEVLKHSPAPHQVWVADNGSSDESRALLQAQFPQVHTLFFDQNFGFAEGYNKAIAQIPNDLVLLLNSDVAPSAHWLNPLQKAMEDFPDCAACQPKVLAYKDPERFEYAGASGGFIDALGYPFCRGRLFDSCEIDHAQYQNPIRIAWATGCALLVRRKAYLEAGGLDPSFFAHMEEIDLCWRLQAQGHWLAVIPQSTVYHVGGGTLDQLNPRKTYLNFRNNLLLLAKNLPRLNLFPILLMRMILDGVAALKMLFGPKGMAQFLAVFKAHIHFYLRIPQVLRERKKIKKKTNAPLSRVYLVWRYFVKKQSKFSELGLQEFPLNNTSKSKK